MSRDRGTISFVLEESLSPDEWPDLLNDFAQIGWQYRHPKTGVVDITLLGEDYIGWEGVRLTDQQLVQHIAQKSDLSETFAIALFHFDTHEGLVLRQDQNTLSFDIGETAKDIPGHLIVDYNPYLKILIPLVFKHRKPFDLSISAWVDRV